MQADNVIPLRKKVSAQPGAAEGGRAARLGGGQFYYQTPALTAILDALRDGVAQRPVLVVHGEHGSGKSALLEQLLDRADPGWHFCYLQLSHVYGEQHVLEAISRQLLGRELHQVEDIVTHLPGSFNTSAIITILIDDAHNLSPFALKALLALKQQAREQGYALGMALFAGPEIIHVLDTSAFAKLSGWFTRLAVPGLDAAQTAEYIEQRLTASGLAQRVRMDKRILHSFHARSSGLPLFINQFLEDYISRQLNSNVLQRWFDRNRRLLGRMVTASAVLALAGFVVLIVVDHRRPQHAEPSLALAALSSSLPQDGLTPPTVAASATRLPVKDVLPAAARPALTPAPLPAALPPAARAPQPPVAVSPAAAPVATAGKAAAAARPAAAQAGDPVLGNEGFQTWLQQLEDIRDGDAWLMAQTAGNYTLQLAAAFKEREVDAFIQRYHLSPKAAKVRLLQNGRDVYVALLGVFPTVARTKQVVLTLPDELQQRKPWIRDLGALKPALAVVAGDAPDNPSPADGEPVMPEAAAEPGAAPDIPPMPALP